MKGANPPEYQTKSENHHGQMWSSILEKGGGFLSQ